MNKKDKKQNIESDYIPSKCSTVLTKYWNKLTRRTTKYSRKKFLKYTYTKLTDDVIESSDWTASWRTKSDPMSWIRAGRRGTNRWPGPAISTHSWWWKTVTSKFLNRFFTEATNVVMKWRHQWRHQLTARNARWWDDALWHRAPHQSVRGDLEDLLFHDYNFVWKDWWRSEMRWDEEQDILQLALI